MAIKHSVQCLGHVNGYSINDKYISKLNFSCHVAAFLKQSYVILHRITTIKGQRPCLSSTNAMIHLY